jgi:hypothetical protein
MREGASAYALSVRIVVKLAAAAAAAATDPKKRLLDTVFMRNLPVPRLTFY